MKVIVVDGSSLGPVMKGVGRYTANVLRALGELDTRNEYTILVGRGERLPALPQRERFRYLPISIHNHYWHNGWTLPRMARETGADLVWLPSESGVGGMPCPFAMVCHDVPQLIATSQEKGGARTGALRKGMMRADGRLLRTAMERAAFVFANSHFVGGWLEQELRGGREKIRYAPCAPGADFATLSAGADRAAIRARLDCAGGYVLAFATGDRRENFESVVAAFDRVARETGWHLVVAGTRGKEAGEIRAQVGAFSWRERVRILPFFGEDEMKELAEVYAGAEVYLDLSLHEGFGMQVIEAMACGTPVVCSARGALPEVAGEAALLVDPLDAEACAKELRRAGDEGEERERLIREGRAQAAKYTWRQTAQVILDSFEEM